MSGDISKEGPLNDVKRIIGGQKKLSKPDYISNTRLNFDQQWVGTLSSLQKLGLHIDRAVYPNKGETHIHGENISLSMQYEPIPSDDVPEKISKYFLEHIPNHQRESWKVMRSFSVTNSTNNKKLDVMELVLPGYRIFFRPSSGDYARVIHDNDINVIQISGDFAQLRTLLSLMHEIGHVHVDKQYDPDMAKKITDIRKVYTNYSVKLTQNDLQLVVQDEINAWDFVLKLLQPFINPSAHSFLSEKAIKEDMAYSLKSYWKIIDERLGRAPISL